VREKKEGRGRRENLEKKIKHKREKREEKLVIFFLAKT
jgi:hypothetical protein